MASPQTFTAGNDRFEQGLSPENVGLDLRFLGGDDVLILNRSDDFGGGNRADMGAGADAVVNFAEAGNLILLGDGRDTYVSRGFGSFATDAADTVRGGAGDDMIAVETFKSLYTGDGGNDSFFSVGWQNSFIGGAGRDSISYEPRDDDFTQGGSGVTVDLGAGRAQTGASRFETLRGIEDVVGSGADDAIFGNRGANRITGGLGGDQLTGRGGADTFIWRAAAEAGDLVTDFKSAQGDRLDLSAMDANLGAAGDQAFRLVAGFTGQAGQLRFAGQVLAGDVTGDGLADFEIALSGVSALAAGDVIL